MEILCLIISNLEEGAKLGVITSGISYSYTLEALSLLELGETGLGAQDWHALSAAGEEDRGVFYSVPESSW